MPKHSIGPFRIGKEFGRSFILHPDVPTFTVAAFLAAHPSGKVPCGSCGALMTPGYRFEYLEEEFGPDAEIAIEFTHNHYLDDERPEDYVPAAEAPAPVHALLYEEGTRETYVRNGDGREERLFGVVYREAVAPERPYREIWYPTGEFRAPAEANDAKA